MKMSRISAAVVAPLALLAAGHAHADGVTGSGETVRLDTVHRIWVSGDNRGPNRVGQNTGAGIMDANFMFDQTTAAKAAYDSEVLIGAVYTRSANQRNNTNSYMQGGFALAKLTDKGVELGQPIDLPQLNGERAFMRPLIAFTPKYVILIAASEDNNSNNGNPKPVMWLADKATGELVKIANNTRGSNSSKPTDLITQAVRDGLSVNNPNNQRGPHMIKPITDNSFLVGMQYNNQAQEVFRVTVNEDSSVRMNWLRRYSNNAVHNRPHVSYSPGESEGYMTAVECNAQPANIGVRLTKFNIASGQSIESKIVVRADPRRNKYVAEPHIADVGDKIAIGFAYSARARSRLGNNGHAGGGNVTQLALYDKATLSQVGDMLQTPANYQRHAGYFSTTYGPNGETAIGVISGSSTGTSKGLLQVIPLKADGTLGLKDPMKMYTVSTYSDVANLQARGKRNPNNQAKGFINGLGNVPNPGFDKADGFYREVKSFSMSTVTGYSGPEAAERGLKESLWLSLVPATWKEGLKTTPGQPSEEAGNGPAPRTTDPATDPSGEATSQEEENVLEGTEATLPDGTRRGAGLGMDSSSCSVTNRSASSPTGAFAFGLALAGVLALARRRKEEV
jgi:MYXO-CTERM domain-containing protein